MCSRCPRQSYIVKLRRGHLVASTSMLNMLVVVLHLVL